MKTKLSRTLLECVIKTSEVASKDATRYHLNGVLVNTKNQAEIEIVATDGNCILATKLGYEHYQAEVKTKEKMTSFMVMSDMIKPLAQAMRGVKYAEEFEFDSVTLNVKIGALQLTFDGDLPKNYPDYPQIIPTKTGYNYKLSLNADLLTSMLKLLGNSKNGSVIIEIKDAASPLIVTPYQDRDSALGKSMGVIMPMTLPGVSRVTQEHKGGFGVKS